MELTFKWNGAAPAAAKVEIPAARVSRAWNSSCVYASSETGNATTIPNPDIAAAPMRKIFETRVKVTSRNFIDGGLYNCEPTTRIFPSGPQRILYLCA
jgi:hypothetical protein